MVKDKTKTGVPNRHLHARISYLQQAATYLSTKQDSPNTTRPDKNPDISTDGIQGTKKSNDVESTESPGPALSKRSSGSAPKHAVEPNGNEELTFESAVFGGLPLLLSSHMAQVARKSQIRLHSRIKHATCKRCNTPLIEGQTCTKSIENLSKDGRKPHADMLVVKCLPCGASKRWPVGAKRQQRKTARRQRIHKVEGASAENPGTEDGR